MDHRKNEDIAEDIDSTALPSGEHSAKSDSVLKPLATSMAPPPPDAAMLGKFQLLAMLGKGGMAEVYLAVARGPSDFNKLVVVKQLNSESAIDETIRRMFLDEARLAVRLNHPNVVQTYEIGEHADKHFLVMEYLEGQPLVRLSKYLSKAKTKMSPAMAVYIIMQALSGLHYAHVLRDYDGTPLRIVHRDLSPHNIFVTYDGIVKLVDFGIAKATKNSSKTQAGTIKGKVSYMAPEQVLGDVDARADLFTIGAVLWELIANQSLVKKGETSVKTLTELLTGAPMARLSSVVPDIDPKLDDIVARSLEKDPTHRFQSAGEMRDALLSYVTSSGARVGQDEVGQLMGEAFSEKRESVRRVVHNYVINPTLGPMSTVPSGLGVADSGLRSELGTVVSAGGKDSRIESGTVRYPTPPKRGLLVGAGVLVLVATGAAVFRVMPKSTHTPAAATTVELPTASPPPLASVVAPQIVAQPKAAEAPSSVETQAAPSPTTHYAPPAAGAPRGWGRPGQRSPAQGAAAGPSATVAAAPPAANPTVTAAPQPTASTAPAKGRVFRTDL